MRNAVPATEIVFLRWKMIQSISQTGGVKNKMESGIVLSHASNSTHFYCQQNNPPELSSDFKNDILICATQLRFDLHYNCRLKDGPFSSRKLPQ